MPTSPDAPAPSDSEPARGFGALDPGRPAFEPELPSDGVRGARALVLSGGTHAETSRLSAALRDLGCHPVVVARQPSHAAALAAGVAPHLVLVDLRGAANQPLAQAAMALRRGMNRVLVVLLPDRDHCQDPAVAALMPHGVAWHPLSPGALAGVIDAAFVRARFERAQRGSVPDGLDAAFDASSALARRQSVPFCAGILQARLNAPVQPQHHEALYAAIRDRIRAVIGPGGGVTRVSPLGFAFVCPTGGPTGIARPGSALVDAFAVPVQVAGDPIALRVSVGLAAWSPRTDSLETLLQAADAVLPLPRRGAPGRWRAATQPQAALAGPSSASKAPDRRPGASGLARHRPEREAADGSPGRLRPRLPEPLGAALGLGALAFALLMFTQRAGRPRGGSRG